MRKNRISQSKQYCLIEHSIPGTISRTAASFIDVHRNAATRYPHHLRQIIVKELEAKNVKRSLEPL